MERSILIHFDNATGEVRVEAEGFEGLSCLSATQPFEEALGVVEGDRTFKDEAQTQQLRTTNSNQTRLRQ
ncbi:DUF2997 domain-containing protein [Nostoc sp. 'Peltigera membranacea cyanobiont' 232]|uniref:DUF2997 domain-containing protein n=1 Tax=Nostoc sp. 'Peltigera membranacea cyanobiont' 232 TaxID=2014531 RepID=UPI000B950B9D|nr:DUF2997 domain-containing protein [Nostoc sp. 'Peltigera membranacea cyanobiont' 232]OYE00120.1 hypothetical protein CDG79_36925 [Nostoc sp. 'Peltigera membranacea cyanobiont' 232]